MTALVTREVTSLAVNLHVHFGQRRNLARAVRAAAYGTRGKRCADQTRAGQRCVN